MRKCLIALFLPFCVGCQTSPSQGVVVSRAYPADNCREVGQVIGRAYNRDQAHEQALKDIRFQATQKNANYVRVIAEAAYSRAMRGIAYRCE